MLNNKLHADKLKKVVVATGGGFDPIHKGHVRLFKEAKKLGDILIVMLNSDEQLIKKKGSTFYPSQNERKEIKPDILAKGGDRIADGMPEIELNICKELGCKIIYNVGGAKIQSSSWLIKRVK
jgi:D-beta-D-heptose 7-phosphate kinase/D-beta-D-heptose 1-phosphate adenosyltransferase